MKETGKFNGTAHEQESWQELDPEVRQALSDFRSSVHAWGDAMLSRPRSAHAAVVVRRTWRLAAGWAMAAVLVAGAVSGGVYEHHQRVEQARIAAEHEAAHQRELAAQRAQQEEELLARVDSAVSREVPSALEPLASLMTDDVSSK